MLEPVGDSREVALKHVDMTMEGLARIYEWEFLGISDETLHLVANRRSLGWQYLVSIPVTTFDEAMTYPNMLLLLAIAMKRAAMDKALWGKYGSMVPTGDGKDRISENGARTYLNTLSTDIFGMGVWLELRASKVEANDDQQQGILAVEHTVTP